LLGFSSSPSSAQSHPVRVGVLSGLTGAAAKWGRFQNMGIVLAKEELQSEGYPIEVIFEDSQTQSPRAIAAYNKLFDFNKVDAILADDFGFVIAPLLPRLRQQKRFLVALSLPHDKYCAAAPGYFYSITSQFSLSRAAFEEFFLLHPELKRAAIIAFDDPEWGQSYRDIWTFLAKRHQVDIVDTFYNSEWSPDYKSALTKILSKKPQAIFIAHESEGFFKARSQLGFDGYIVSANNIFEMLADSTVQRPEIEGVFVVEPLVSREFRVKFEKRFGRAPILEAYAGYEGLRAMSRAFKKDPMAPQLAMRTLKYQGVAGPIDFTGASCAGNLAEWGLFQIKNGAAVQIRR